MPQKNPVCEVLETLKKELASSNLDDKGKLNASIDRLMEIKHCDGRRR